MSQAGLSTASTSLQAQMQGFANGISSLVNQSLHREIEQKTRTEYYSGDNSSFLQLRQYPVLPSGLIVCIDETGYAGQSPGGFDSSLNLVQGVDYIVMPGQNGIGSSGILRRIGSAGTWQGRYSRRQGLVANQPTVPHANIKVTYTAGYAPVPYAIQMAVNFAVMKMIGMAGSGTMTESNSYEDAAESYFSPQLQSQVFGAIEMTLGNFKQIVI